MGQVVEVEHLQVHACDAPAREVPELGDQLVGGAGQPVRPQLLHLAADGVGPAADLGLVAAAADDLGRGPDDLDEAGAGRGPRGVDVAAELLGPEGGRLEGLLLALEDQREELEEQLAEARVASETAVREAEQLRDQIAMLRDREGEVMAAAAARAEALLKDTMQHAARLKRSAREEPEQRSKALEEIGALRQQARKLAGRTPPRPTVEAQGAPAAVGDPLGVGKRVRVASYDAEGPVLERRGDQVVVQLGLIKVEVPVHDVSPAKVAAKAATRRSPVAIGQSSAPRELNLRGERVEAGLELLRDFIIEAHALKAESVRVLHGKGTGALRDAVRSYLKGEKLVERFEDAVPYEGGHGVTVAYLRH